MTPKQTINIAGREFFQTALVTYLLLTLAETLRAGTVSNFFNMNYLLLVVLVTGLGMVLTEAPETPVGQAVAASKQAVVAGSQQVAKAARAVTPAPLRRSINAVVVRGPKVIDLRGQDAKLSPGRPAPTPAPSSFRARRAASTAARTATRR